MTNAIRRRESILGRARLLVLACLLAAGLVLLLVEPAETPTPHLSGNQGAKGVAFGSEPITPLPARLEVDAEKAALGRRLFFDKRLSRDDTIACANCHRFELGGADGRPQAVGIGGARGTVNTPSVFNATLNFRQFWDGRAADLAEQAAGPVHNPIEMASEWPQVVAKLSADRSYADTFRRLYPEGMTGPAIQDAIARFEDTLLTPDSRFDRYLRGERGALDVRERQGYQLFKDLGCAACHQGVNVGGNMYGSLGIFGNFFADRGKDAAEDQGRYNVTHREEDRHRFKVPSLRNVARTAPYFHDGSVATLPEAVRLMAHYQLGRELAPEDVDLLVAFLSTLTGNYEGSQL